MPGKCVVIAPSFALESAIAHMYDGVGSRPQSSQPSSVLVDVQCNYTSSAHPPAYGMFRRTGFRPVIRTSTIALLYQSSKLRPVRRSPNLDRPPSNAHGGYAH